MRLLQEGTLEDVSLPLVWFDESGNTGDDLLNEDQPVFALASVALSESDAEEVLAPVRAASRAAELKFSKLRRRRRSLVAVLEMLESPKLTPSTVRLAVVDKPYMVVAKMCDILMEPAWTTRGWNWYEDDNPFKWPSTLHEEAPRVLGRQRWMDVQRGFIAAVRHPSELHAMGFAHQVLQVLTFMEECDIDDPRVKLPLELMFEQAPSEPSYVDDALDPALPCLVEQIAWWSEQIGPFVVVHDHTNTIDRHVDRIMALCDPRMKPFTQVLGDRAVSYPLKATEITLAASHELPAVQLADLLAGACAFQQAAAGIGGPPARSPTRSRRPECGDSMGNLSPRGRSSSAR
jgi:hypothetical protein